MHQARSLLAGALVSLAIVAAAPRTAEEAPEVESPHDAAFLFTYDIRPGQSALFAEGYRQHLEWHRRAQDPWAWHGWMVLTGDHPGRFVNGAFGRRFADFDRRVDPAGDRADARLHVVPFAEPAARQVLRHRPDLGVGPPWNTLPPSPMLEVTRFMVKPGHRRAFEDTLRDGRSAAGNTNADIGSHTWYELVVGGAEPAYLRIIPRGAWADYDRATPRQDLAESVDEIYSETWLYRSQLSYLPSR